MAKGNLGIGVMIGMLGGNAETVEAFNKGLNQTIKSIKLDEKELKFTFKNKYKMCFLDDGQSCCESRYMRTDDDLKEFVGAKFLGARVEDVAAAPNEEDEYGCHEIQLLVIETSKGNFVISNHNEHNGYYGGFLITVREEK